MAANLEKGDVSYIEAGIHENGFLAGARKDKGKNNGNIFLEISLTKDGRTLTHTEWEPTKYGNQTDDELQSKATKQVARILQILEVYYPKEILSNFEGSTFESFVDWVVSLLNNADKKIPVRFKAVYGNDGYVGLPRYSKYTFIERMDVESSKISALKIDVFTRPEADKQDNSQDSESYFKGSASPASEDLGPIPF